MSVFQPTALELENWSKWQNVNNELIDFKNTAKVQAV